MLMYSFLIESCVIFGPLLDKAINKKRRDYSIVGLIPFLFYHFLSWY